MTQPDPFGTPITLTLVETQMQVNAAWADAIARAKRLVEEML